MGKAVPMLRRQNTNTHMHATQQWPYFMSFIMCLMVL